MPADLLVAKVPTTKEKRQDLAPSLPIPARSPLTVLEALGRRRPDSIAQTGSREVVLLQHPFFPDSLALQSLDSLRDLLGSAPSA